MLRVSKPKNARSKRAMEAREPKAIEDVKSALFIKSTSTSSNVNTALSQLLLLKKPDAISFTKKTNAGIRPFEDAATLEFWSNKNDTSFAILGSHSKKRPNNLTLARMFDHQILDMLELGVESAKSMHDFASRKPAVGQKPLFHFSGDLFSSHPLYIQLKSLLLDLYRGELAPSINMQGLEHVISISHAPLSSTSNSSSAQPITSVIEPVASTSAGSLPKVHFRVYMTRLLKSSSAGRAPYIALEPSGPAFDFTLRRSIEGAPELWKHATKTLKRKSKGEGGAQAKKRSKNWEIDEMGDKTGRIHVGTQDLSKLQSRKMKGLRKDAPTAARKPSKLDVEMDGEDGIAEV